MVNLNGNKCYEFSEDKEQYCADFGFYNNRLLCEEEELNDSNACDIFKPENMDYYTVQELSITLEPRSSCGFFLFEYTAYLDIYHQYPISLYHREYKTVGYSDTEFLVTQSDPDGTLPGRDCFLDKCNNYFYVTYG